MIVTIFLALINIIVFIVMVCSGVSFINPTTQQILCWGGISSETVLHSNEWWRLFTSMFVHIGIIHLIMNLYVLLDIGAYLEPVIGQVRFIAVYFATGIFGNLMSQAWHLDSYVVEAGASGAIFGIIGAFCALLTTRIFPLEIKEPLMKKFAILIGVNIVYGMQSNVSMAAHMGGLLSGCILGYGLYPSLVFSRIRPKLKMVTIYLIALVTFFSALGSLRSMKKSDSFVFDEIVMEVDFIENSINNHIKKIPTLKWEFLLFFNSKLLPELDRAQVLVQKAAQLNLSGPKAKSRDYTVKWLSLVNEKYRLIAKAVKEDNEDYVSQVTKIDDELSKLSIESDH